MQNTRHNIQRWGNDLIIRIPESIARSAHLSFGQTIELLTENNHVIIKPKTEEKLSLAQRLALFCPNIHGGEAMASSPIGEENFK